MANERNYARFYTLLKKMPGAEKELLVSQYTNGRTTHLHETTMQEYNTMCRDMERETGCDEFVEGIRRQLRRKRSVCLKLMQQLDVDTTDWTRVDNFCLHPRIAGKPFRQINIEELEALSVKLRAIKRKEGQLLPPQRPTPPQPSTKARGSKRGAVIMLLANQSIEN